MISVGWVILESFRVVNPPAGLVISMSSPSGLDRLAEESKAFWPSFRGKRQGQVILIWIL